MQNVDDKRDSGISWERLEKHILEQVPEDDIRRVLAKILKAVSIDSLHPIAKTIQYSSVEASGYGIPKCLELFNLYVKKGSNTRHPVYVVDNLILEGDAVFSPDVISGVEAKGSEIVSVEIKSKMGIFCKTDEDREKAVASTMIASSTTRLDKGVENVYKDSRKLEYLTMKKVDLVTARSFFEEEFKSPVIARDFIYTSMKSNDRTAQVIIDIAYRDVPYGEPNPKVLRYTELILKQMNAASVRQNKKTYAYKPVGKRPGAFKEEYDIGDIDFPYVAGVSNILTQTVGDSEKGRGGVSSVYYFGEITAAWHKVISRCVEIMYMLERYKLTVVRLPEASKTFGTNLIRVLIANGVPVVNNNGLDIYNRKDGKSGHYRYTDEPCLEVAISPFSPIVFKKEGPIYPSAEKHKVEMRTFLHASAGVRVCLSKMTPALWEECENGVVSLLPSTSAASLKMWVVNSHTNMGDGWKKVNIRRMMRMIIAKAKFPFTRLPAFFMDEFKDMFDRKIIIPHVDKKEVKDVITNVAQPKKVTLVERLDDNIYGEQKLLSVVEPTDAEIATSRIQSVASLTTNQERIRRWHEILMNDTQGIVDNMLMNDDIRNINISYQAAVAAERSSKQVENQIIVQPPDKEESEDNAELDELEKMLKADKDKVSVSKAFVVPPKN